MTPVAWISFGAIILVLILVAVEVLKKEPQTIKWDHVARRDDFTEEAAAYEVRGMPRNAEACMRSAEEEHRKAFVRDDAEVTE